MTDKTQTGGFRVWLRQRHEILTLGAILVVALALRLYQLEASSFWIDELTQIRWSRLPFGRMLADVMGGPGQAPLDYIVTHYVYYYIGRSEGILRLPAVVWGVLSVAAVYGLGRRMFDKTTGLLAAALLAILPIHIYYSQEMRPYSLAVLMVLLATLAFHRALSRNTRGAWALYGGTLVVGMYAHYHVAVVGILHGAYLLWMALAKWLPWRSLRPYLVAAGIAGLLFLPWVAWDIYYMESYLKGLLTTGYTFVFPELSNLVQSLSASLGITYPFTADNPLTWLVGTACALAAGVALAIVRKSKRRNELALMAVVSLGGATCAVLLDYVGGYPFLGRRIVPFVPLVVLLACAAYVALVRWVFRRLAHRPADWVVGALAATVLLGFSVGMLQGSLASTYKQRKQDWRGVSRYLLQHAEPEDVVLLRVTFDVEFYAPELSGQIVELRNIKTVREAAKTHPRVWIVDWSSALDRYVPDVGEWVESEKPLRIKGFTGLRLYVYSETLTPQELEDSLKR